jgi:hypothetical protein
MAQSVTLSSVGTATIILNPVSRSTTVGLITGTAASTGTVTVEFTLDDPTIVGGPSLSWFTLSSGAAMLSSNVTNLVYTVLSPIGGVRINSTANNNTWTLKALQSVIA